MVDIIVWVVLPFLAFGIMMFFFAWAGSVIARRRIVRLLQQDEIVLRKAEAFGLPAQFSLRSLFSFPWQGTVYLTNRRLIWRRYLLAYGGPGFLGVALNSVDECSVRRFAWLRSLQIKAGGELLIFHLYRHALSLTVIHNRGFAGDMAKAINQARECALGASP